MSRDLRKYSSQTTTRLVAGAILILFVVGLGLIWYLYGRGAALMGLLCLLGALVPMALIWLFFFGMDAIIKRANGDE